MEWLNQKVTISEPWFAWHHNVHIISIFFTLSFSDLLILRESVAWNRKYMRDHRHNDMTRNPSNRLCCTLRGYKWSPEDFFVFCFQWNWCYHFRKWHRLNLWRIFQKHYFEFINKNAAEISWKMQKKNIFDFLWHNA